MSSSSSLLSVLTLCLLFVTIVNGIEQTDGRMVAYIGNWFECPTPDQFEQYTHIIIAFAVSYTWTPAKNECHEMCEISTPPVCGNQENMELIDTLRSQGKKVMISFGGAGMGGTRWDGVENDCWLDCFGREQQVIDRLVELTVELDLDGVDLSYMWHTKDNGSFDKGQDAMNFLTTVVNGLREQLPKESLISLTASDKHMAEGDNFFEMLKTVNNAVDFIQPHYYNGITHPISDGFHNDVEGTVSAAGHYQNLIDTLFGGDATRIVFGFCILDCTSFNADGAQAAAVMKEVTKAHYCNGGVSVWVSEHDYDGEWSSTVNSVLDCTRGCNGGDSVVVGSSSGDDGNTTTVVAETRTAGLQDECDFILTMPPTMAPTMNVTNITETETSNAGNMAGSSIVSMILAPAMFLSWFG